MVDSSRNGTFVNGEQAIKGEPTQLQEGDTLHLSLPLEDAPEIVYE